jgi:hypothetical protein
MRGTTKNSIGLTHGNQGVGLLVHYHGAELRGKGRTSPSSHNDTGHHGTHLPRHGQAYQVRHVNLRAELLQLVGAHKGHDQAHEETDE